MNDYFLLKNKIEIKVRELQKNFVQCVFSIITKFENQFNKIEY